MSPRSEAEREAIADEEEALEVALHARLLGDGHLFREASDRVEAARVRVAQARAERRALERDLGQLATGNEDDIDRELEELLRSADVALNESTLPTFERALAGQAGVDVGPPPTYEFRAGAFLFRLVSVSESLVEVIVESTNERLSGQLLMITVLESSHPREYPIALYSERDGLTVGYLLMRTLEQSLVISEVHPLLAAALGPQHTEAIDRALERLPPEAEAAWRAIARVRAPGDPVREEIASALGGL